MPHAGHVVFVPQADSLLGASQSRVKTPLAVVGGGEKPLPVFARASGEQSAVRMTPFPSGERRSSLWEAFVPRQHNGAH
jgi:hypothetical protein